MLSVLRAKDAPEVEIRIYDLDLDPAVVSDWLRRVPWFAGKAGEVHADRTTNRPVTARTGSWMYRASGHRFTSPAALIETQVKLVEARLDLLKRRWPDLNIVFGVRLPDKYRAGLTPGQGFGGPMDAALRHAAAVGELEVSFGDGYEPVSAADLGLRPHAVAAPSFA